MKLSRLDPRLKLFILLGVSALAVAARSARTSLALLVLTLLILLLGGVGPAELLRRGGGVFGLILGVFIVQCLFEKSGEALLTLGSVTVVTRGGLSAAALVSLRLLCVACAALVVRTSAERDWLLALAQLRLPYELIFAVLAGLRFLPLLREEARDILSAMQMRGLRLKKAGPAKRLSAYLSVAVPAAAGAIRRSEAMSAAMEARGFGSMPRRTSMRRLAFGRADAAYFAVFCVIFSFITYMEATGWTFPFWI